MTEGEKTRESYGISYENSEANRVNMSTNDGETWGWSRREGEQHRASRVKDLRTRCGNTVGMSAEGPCRACEGDG